MLKIMTEASGSLASGYMMKAIRAAGHAPVGSDITPFTAAMELADENVVAPPCDHPELWAKLEKLLIDHRIDVVIPSFDFSLAGWAERRDYFKKLGITVIISPLETVRTFLDKWLTFQFFQNNGIPCPATSLAQRYPLLKPRYGSGSKGIVETTEARPMDGYISQQIIKGTEYTVDCLFDRQGVPVYVIPRRRMLVRDGKSTQGETVDVPAIRPYIERMAAVLPFNGPVNFQCFEDENGAIWFIEANPRPAGGLALGFAASENWVPLLIKNFVDNEPISPKPVEYGLRMIRYYADFFVSTGSMA